MASFRDVIPSCKYDDNNHVEFSSQQNHRNEIESALEHICRLGWRQIVSWRHVVILVTSWRHVMTWTHHASTNTILAWNPAIEIITEIHVYHHFRTSTSWYRRSEFCDIMTSRHDVMTSCKRKNNNIFKLSKPENYRNKTRIISLAILRAEIEYRLFLTSWHDVMTWRHHAKAKLTTFSNSATRICIETKKNHLSSTSTSWDRENKFGCVMLWRHAVTVLRGWVKSKSLNCILWMGRGAMEKLHF